MTPQLIADIMRDSIYVIIKISLPLVLVALVVGLIISLIQALTQIQEQTLTFVPKILAIFATMIIAGHFMFNVLLSFSDRIFSLIATGH